MQIIPIEAIGAEAWDRAISGFESRLLFHRSAWLSFLEETQSGITVRFKIVQDGRIVGFFVGILMKKGFLKILGSPLATWLTDYMGPLFNPGFDQEVFLLELHALCRRWKIHTLEIGNPFLDQSTMQKHGFRCSQWNVYGIPVSSDIDDMWKNLTGKCKNRIRKGYSNELVVEDCVDPAFVDEHYDQLLEVFAKQRRLPEYSLQTIRSLYENLKHENLLLTLRVQYKGRTIATGMFPHDDRFVFSFGIASRTEFQKLCPNELLYWTVMSIAGQAGLKEFYIGGVYKTPESGGLFKKKFNGRDMVVYRYIKNYSVFATAGRKIYKYAYHAKRKLKDRLLT